MVSTSSPALGRDRASRRTHRDDALSFAAIADDARHFLASDRPPQPGRHQGARLCHDAVRGRRVANRAERDCAVSGLCLEKYAAGAEPVGSSRSLHSLPLIYLTRGAESVIGKCEVCGRRALSEVRTSSHDFGWRAASAFSQCRCQVRRIIDPHPRGSRDRAIAAWSQDLNSPRTDRSRVHDPAECVVVETTVMIGMSCSTAVIQPPFIVIREAPSQQTATTGGGRNELGTACSGMAKPTDPRRTAAGNPPRDASGRKCVIMMRFSQEGSPEE